MKSLGVIVRAGDERKTWHDRLAKNPRVVHPLPGLAMRFPVQPFWDYALREPLSSCHPEASARVDRVAGVTPRTIFRWKSDGLNIWTADRLATHVGLHPSQLWPEWWDAA